MIEDRSILTREAPAPTIALDSGDLYLARPVIVLIHGGFWRPEYDRTHLRPMAAALRDCGFDVLSVEYRRVPGQPDATVADVLAAVRAVPRAAAVVGHSAGGHLALWVAATLGLNAVALAPVADLQLAEKLHLDDGAVGAFLGGPAAGRPDLDPARMATAESVLIHGAEDTVVPIALSEAYVAAHPTSRLVAVPATAHFELIDPTADAWPIVLQELRRLLA